MPIQINEASDGKSIEIHASGILAKTDYEQLTPKFEGLIRKFAPLRVLFDMTGFHGWEDDAFLEEIKFDIKHFANIKRCAMVGDQKWQQVMVTFCKPFTKTTIRYFDHAETSEARKWLAEV
jgi:hypothetical protein